MTILMIVRREKYYSKIRRWENR